MAEEQNLIDVAVIGAGTAGMTAAIYAQRAGKHAVLFEGLSFGGQIVNTPDIENYPGIEHISGFDFANALYRQAMDLGAELIAETVLRVEPLKKECPAECPPETGGKTVFEIRTSSHTYTARSVILAAGAKNRPLGLSREAELVGKGVSYCATCDGMFFRGKDAAVVGGGNTALEDAAFLSNICRTVYLIHRRDEFRGSAAEAEALKKKTNVKFILSSVVTEILGETNVTGIRVQSRKTGKTEDLPVSGLFIAVGQVPANEAFSNLVKLDAKGYIAADETCRTETEGVFAAGDCRTKDVRQLTTAASDGAVAALAAVQYIG